MREQIRASDKNFKEIYLKSTVTLLTLCVKMDRHDAVVSEGVSTTFARSDVEALDATTRWKTCLFPFLFKMAMMTPTPPPNLAPADFPPSA